MNKSVIVREKADFPSRRRRHKVLKARTMVPELDTETEDQSKA